MPTATTTPRSYRPTRTRRVLGSSLIDLMVGPHGIDRYLELVRPSLTIAEPRAEVLAVRHQTDRSVTLTLHPNSAFNGFIAGQFVRVGVEIDGIRRTRTYSPASSELAEDGLLELTVTLRDRGLVSHHLRDATRPGTLLHLSDASGEFILPDPRPERVVLISGGSGITPVISMLRTLCDEEHRGAVEFIHFARTDRDWLYRPEVEMLAARHPNLRVRYVATRQGGPRLGPGDLRAADTVAVCGPPALIEATRGLLDGADTPVLAETFAPPTLQVSGRNAAGTIRFLDSGTQTPIGTGTLLEQAEAAGLTPEYGCRMGICHTCTCRKSAGAVQNILTGEVSNEEDEDIQLCISVPAGDVALEI